jgi:integrase/recombinase XerD
VRNGDRLIEMQIAAGGFLAGYSGNTLLACRQDLVSFFDWCHRCGVGVFDVRRSHLELFARSLEVGGYARATTARRLSTLSSFYRYCSEEEFVPVNPAANVRRPKVRHESTMHGLDCNELGAFLVQAGLSNERDHALACLLALNGLRVSEALGCDITDLGMERGHHTLKVLRKSGKEITAPLAPRTARTVYLAVGERHKGPIFTMDDGQRMDRHQAARIVARFARRAASTNASPHIRCVIASSQQRSTQESRCETSRKRHHTPIHGQLCDTTGQGDHSTDTPPT